MSKFLLNRVLRAAGVSFVAVSSWVVPLAAVAQTLTAPLVVTGSREPMASDRLAADVVVIESAALRASPADSLADLLRREAGVQMTRNGGPGHASGLMVRGAFGGHVVVLVDGARVGSATLGQASLDGLPLSQIERIEVLRGPGSSLYGADAIGGVVQVFTRRAAARTGTQLEAEAAVGGYGSRQANAALSHQAGLWDLAVSLSHEKSDGVSTVAPGDLYGNHNPDNDGHTLNSLQARVGLRPAAGHQLGLTVLRSKLNAHYDASEYPAPNYAQDNTPDFRTRLTTETVSLDWRGRVLPNLTASARAAHSLDDTLDGGNTLDRFKTRRQQFSAQLAWAAGTAGQLIGALEQGTDRAESPSFLAPVERRTTAAVLGWTGDVGPFSWQADLRRDDSSDFGAVNTGRLGGSYRVLPGLRLRALAGNTFRAASFNDLYYPGYGVATLAPERGRSVELGLAWETEAQTAAFTVYRNQVRDLIAYTGDLSLCPADPAYSFGCAANVNRARLAGASLSGSQRLGAFTLKAAADFTDAKDERTGARLNRRAAHQESLGLDWTQGAYSAAASLQRLGARPDGGKTLAAETTLDLQVRWRFAKSWQLQAKLLNVTDERIEPARDYQGLGRQAWLGLRFEGGL